MSKAEHSNSKQQRRTRPDLLFVATRAPYPPVTGHYLRTFNILKGLSAKFRIHLFAFWDKNTTAEEQREARRRLGQFCSSIHIEPVRTEQSPLAFLLDIFLSLLTLKPFTAKKYSSRAMHEEIRRILHTHDIRIAHADSLQSGQYIVNLAVPKLITNHNVEFLRLRRYAMQRNSIVYRALLGIQVKLTKRYELRVLHNIGNCVVVSRDDKATLSGLLPSVNFFVVPNGTEISEPPLPPPHDGLMSALWVGGMNDPFNREAVLHFAFQILPKIRSHIPGFTWIVVGREPPQVLLNLANSPGSGIVLSGFVHNLREAYRNSAIVVVPLISGGGTKLKVLEAMSMGRAVVTTPIGAEGLSATDGVDMEIASSDSDFAQRVVRLLQNSKHRNRVAEAARALAEAKYSWESINQRMTRSIEIVQRMTDATT